MESINRELEELVREENRVLTLKERAAQEASKFPRAVLRQELPPKFLRPTEEFVVDILERYGAKKAKGSVKDNIFYTNPRETLQIFQQVADIVVETKKPTVYPDEAVGRSSSEHVVETLHATEKLNLSHDDTLLVSWWITAADDWLHSDEPTEDQFKILRTMLSMIYDISIDNAFPFKYQLGAPPQDLFDHGTMSVQYVINDDIVPDEGYGIYGSLSTFMLVSACANMIGKPEQHIFSTTCNCWVCLMSPEYYRVLKTTPNLPKISTKSIIDGELTYISTDYLDETIPRFRLLGNELVEGAIPLFLSAKGVVQLTEDNLNDLIGWTLKNVPNQGGVMFKSDNILETDLLVDLFEKELMSVRILSKSEQIKTFRGITVKIIKCETEDVFEG